MTAPRPTLEEIFAMGRNPALSPEEKALWLLYRSFDFRGEGAWPGEEVLAHHLGKSVRSVRRYRHELMEKGYLVQELRGPKPALYHPVVPEDPPAPPPEETESLATDGQPLSTTAPEARPPVAKQTPEARPGMARQEGESPARDGQTSPSEELVWPSVTESLATGDPLIRVMNTEEPSPPPAVSTETEPEGSRKDTFGWDAFAGWYRTTGHRQLWGGDAPPEWAGDGWNIPRDLSIARRLHAQGEDLEELRAVIEAATEPSTMATFWQAGRRDRLEVAKARVHRNQELEQAHVGAILHQLAKASRNSSHGRSP